MKIIKTKKDIKSIKLGDQYIIDGPEDPLEFCEVCDELKPLIEKHIEKLQSPKPKRAKKKTKKAK